MNTNALTLTRSVAASLGEQLNVETKVTGDLMFGHSIRFKFGAEKWETGIAANRSAWQLGRNGDRGVGYARSVVSLPDGADADPDTITGFIMDSLRTHFPDWPTPSLADRFFRAQKASA